MKLSNHPLLNLGYFVHTNNSNGVVVWSIEFIIDSYSTLKFITAVITESSTFVFIIMGPISPPKIVPTCHCIFIQFIHLGPLKSLQKYPLCMVPFSQKSVLCLVICGMVHLGVGCVHKGVETYPHSYIIL